MARPEITGRKVEETTIVESKKKGKGKTTRKRHPLPPRREGDAYTISEFCAANRISASMYHKLKSLGLHAGSKRGVASRARARSRVCICRLKSWNSSARINYASVFTIAGWEY